MAAKQKLGSKRRKVASEAAKKAVNRTAPGARRKKKSARRSFAPAMASPTATGASEKSSVKVSETRQSWMQTGAVSILTGAVRLIGWLMGYRRARAFKPPSRSAAT